MPSVSCLPNLAVTALGEPPHQRHAVDLLLRHLFLAEVLVLTSWHERNSRVFSLAARAPVRATGLPYHDHPPSNPIPLEAMFSLRDDELVRELWTSSSPGWTGRDH